MRYRLKDIFFLLKGMLQQYNKEVVMAKKKASSVSLNKKQVIFLDKISMDCKSSGGAKFSRKAIMNAILTAGSKVDLDFKKIKSEKELHLAFIKAFKKSS